MAKKAKGNRVPVSYTHLDVYKRQVIFSPRFILAFGKVSMALKIKN